MPGGSHPVPLPLSRRRLLAGVGLSALAGVGAAALRGQPLFAHSDTDDHAPGDPTIRAATVWAGGYAGLVGDAEHHIHVHSLQVAADRRVTIGDPLGVELPHEFQPWAITTAGGRLWITGAMAHLFEVVTVDNRIEAVPEELREMAGPGDPDLPNEIFDMEVWHYRPALFAVRGTDAEQVDLPVPAVIRWGAATGIVADDSGTVAVAMDGSPDPDAAIVTRTHLALSSDGGRSWRQRLLDDRLREGFATALVGTHDRLVAVSVDGQGTRTLRSGILGADLDLALVDAVHDAGPVLAAVPDGAGGVHLLTEAAGGGIAIDAYRQLETGQRTDATEAPCDCATTEVVAVSGVADTWIVLTDDGGTLETSGRD